MRFFNRKTDPVRPEQAASARSANTAQARADRKAQLAHEEADAISWSQQKLVQIVNAALRGQYGTKTIRSPYGDVTVGVSQRGTVYVTTGGYLIGKALAALYPEYDVRTERITDTSRHLINGSVVDLPFEYGHCTEIRARQ